MDKKSLYKTVIIIWSEQDCSDRDLVPFVKDAERGYSYCSKFKSEKIDNLEEDPDYDGNQFFDKIEDQ